MTTEFNNDSLDRLLSQPAAVRDENFTAMLQSRLSRVARRTTRIYAWVGLAWLCCALLLSSPNQLLLLLGQLATAFNQLPQSTVELAKTMGNELAQSPDITVSPSLVILTLLLVYALANLLRQKI